MWKKYLFFSIFLIIFQKNCLIGEGGSIAELEYGYRQFNSIIYMMAGFPFATESNDFFENYADVMEGQKEDFNVIPIFCIGTKFEKWQNFRFGFETEYFYAYFNDDFVQKYATTDEVTVRSLTENVKVSSIPALVTFDFIPYNQQFRTYIGGGLGLCFTNYIWEEKLESTDEYDDRIGGTHYKELHVDPMLRFYTGMELGFDKLRQQNILGSLVLELKYTAYFREVRMFSAIKDQFKKPPLRIDESVTILPGFLGLYIGITFNFNRRIK